MSTTAMQMFDIKEAGKATGLSPSVLRIWELRYGWPNPRRKSNGYRTYFQHQIDDICKVAAMVRQGIPVSSIIVDGSPRWPSNEGSAPSARLLPRTRSLPVPKDPQHAALQRDPIKAFVNLDALAVRGLLPRIYWTVRPCDEPVTALVPVVVALAELRAGKQPLADSDEILRSVHERCIQLMRMQRVPESAIPVVPARAVDEALAALAAAMLCFRGSPARLWCGMREPSQPYLSADDSGGVFRSGTMRRGTITSLARDDAEEGVCLAQLLDCGCALPWDLPMSTAPGFQDVSGLGAGTVLPS